MKTLKFWLELRSITYNYLNVKDTYIFYFCLNKWAEAPNRVQNLKYNNKILPRSVQMSRNDYSTNLDTIFDNFINLI